tara:strand:- start:1249 stop:1920 length:672 start_codon:yes stop_codon:yes gene_type:complete
MISVHSGSSPFDVFNDLTIDGNLDVTGNLKLNRNTDFDNLTIPGNLIVTETDTGNSGVYYETANTSQAAASRYQIQGNGIAYIFDVDQGNNPELYVEVGYTYAFDLQQLNNAHPFVIRTSNNASTVNDGGTYYNVGLTHVEIESAGGSVKTSTGFDAQRKKGGILYWKVPEAIKGDILYYQCTAHAGNMVGPIYIGNSEGVAFDRANSASDDALAFAIGLTGH